MGHELKKQKKILRSEKRLNLKITKNFTWGNIEVRACVWGLWGVQIIIGQHHATAVSTGSPNPPATRDEKTHAKADAKSLNGRKHGRKPFNHFLKAEQIKT